MPKLPFTYLGFIFFFWSNEYSGENKLEPCHVHVCKGNPSNTATKIWIMKDGVTLANNGSNISERELRKVLTFVNGNRKRIIEEWENYFGK